MKKSFFLFSILLPFLFGAAVLAADPKQSDRGRGGIIALAEKGGGEYQYNLGVMYVKGEGVPQDYKAAFKWFSLAAEQGLSMAQFNLGQMHGQGLGVPQDYKMAFKWLTLAAKQGDAKGQYIVGLMYTVGEGVLQDYIRAHMWLNIAASNNAEDASRDRDLVAQHMSPADIAEAEKLAQECLANNYKGC